LIHAPNQTTSPYKLEASGNYNNQIVLVGPSLGGQASHYPLALMEKKFLQTRDPLWCHNCKLWISFDSPHNGANILIGVQHFLNYFKNHDNESAKELQVLFLSKTTHNRQ